MQFLRALIFRYWKYSIDRIISFTLRKKGLPVVYQTDFIECGFACLTMIFCYFGVEITVGDLRRRYPINLSGMSACMIQDIAKDHGFTIKVIRADMDNLHTIKLPAILHWNFDHYVVLKEIKENQFILHDPNHGKLKMKREIFSNFFTGVVFELDYHLLPRRSLGSTLQTHFRGFFTFFHPVFHHYTLCLKLLFLTVIYQFFMLAVPWLLHVAFDILSYSKQYEEIYYVAVGYIALQILIHLSKILKNFCQLKMEYMLNLQLGSRLLHQIITMPLQFFEQRQLSNILYRFHSLEQIRQLLSNGLIDAVWSSLLLLLTAIYLYMLNSKLAAITCIFAVLHVLIRFILSPSQKMKIASWLQAKNLEQGALLEIMRAMLPITVFGKQTLYFTKWLSRYCQFLQSAYQVARGKNLLEQVKSLLTMIEFMLLIVIATATSPLRSANAASDLFIYLFCRQLFIDSLSALCDRWYDLTMLPIYIDKLVDIFHSPLEKNVIEQQPLISSDLAIKVVNLSFRHSPYDQWLFRSLNFTITKGETVVFIGASGSGKSSLIKVLMGLLQPGEGKVLVNHLFTSQAKESIPRFAAVMQNDVLLSGTIAENISFFSDYPDRQKIESCARIAMIWDDIQKWPLQLSTMVGEMGASLSGGQRQRILLARALYVDPDILFLDEATSHLDEPTEHVINKNLKMLGKTCIMVAHRANTIAMADRMIDLTPYLSSVTAA